MDLLSILIAAGVAVWFIAALRYMIKNRGGCSCGGCTGHSDGCGRDKGQASCGLGCGECQACKSKGDCLRGGKSRD